MPNRLADAISPYLRSHADNPVDWHGWGEAAFAEARERDLPVFVSIGYSTCHWCHVMARESFSDPRLAEYLNAHFVSIKVDREEHPDVDASYLAAASAFVEGLGWPLNVFVTPDGRAFHAGTYFPPAALPGHPSFREVLEAVTDAWTAHRPEVLAGAARVAEALAAAATPASHPLPDPAALNDAVAALAAYEDLRFGGFGGAPKFPVAPALGFLLAQADGRELALRTLKAMGASPLRDPIEGGFFRYAVNRDWSEPHYERMLYDNAGLLELYTQAWKLTGEGWAATVATGIGNFLREVLQLPGGGFASAQDSESTVAGERVEGGYYALDAEARGDETRPALDAKVLTGWNGLAITALARAGFAFANPAFTGAARRAADYLLERHRRQDGTLVRASIDARVSGAQATLEDYGMCARGLLELALVTGEVGYAIAGRDLLRSTLASPNDTPASGADGGPGAVFRAPNGADPVLLSQGLAIDIDPSEGAYPSGLSASAGASFLLFELTGEAQFRLAATSALTAAAALAPARPLAFGAALGVMNDLVVPVEQLLIISPEPTDGPGLVDSARRHPTGMVAALSDKQARDWSEAGFALFTDRVVLDSRPTAYHCRDFVCRLPTTDPGELGLPEIVGGIP